MGWFSSGKCTSKARLDGKTVVITGCNTGIGKYTVLDLYSRGARVVMACRNVEKAEEARDWVIEQRSGQQGLGQLSVCHLDLSSLSSVRKCADKLLDEETHIDILINNAVARSAVSTCRSRGGGSELTVEPVRSRIVALAQ
ncbi:hypothetical protein J6590_018256 [Homalodisca vitripennis]|nr:hypothetical protein J6590_018256 [Homalodisca vitripennis]